MSISTEVTLNQAATLITTCGETNTFVFEGEPGIGKSALRHSIMATLGYEPSQFRYVDCALLDLGDLQMPKINDYLEFIANKLFVDDHGEPIVVMLDEIGKAMRPVQNGLLTLLLEHRIGTHYLPEGSIVFATTNMGSDGVGDMFQAHAKNRVTFVRVKKPTADQWIDDWAIENNVAPEVIAWVKEYPHCMASYTDGNSDENPYIFNPRKSQDAFVSPRSLAHAGHLVSKRHILGDDLLLSSLAGTIGKSAAADMQAFLNIADELPSFNSIISNPTKAHLPSSPVASVILCLGAVMRIKKDNIEAWFEYMTRLPRETQFLFANNAARNTQALAVMSTARAFSTWSTENSWAI